MIIAVAHAAISPNETRSLLDGALDGIAAKLRYHGRAFMLGEPFPHVVVDGLFPAAVVEALAAEIPERFDCSHSWTTGGQTCFSRGGHEMRKVQVSDVAAMGPHTRAYTEFVRSAAFRRALEALTGFPEGALVTDKNNKGAGTHVTLPGGYLKVHADFNGDFGGDGGGLTRRVNTFLYLNPDWSDAYQGHLQLWSRNMSTCAREISPILNRFVVFKTDDFSYHGHPVPLLAPEGRARRSIAAYFYTKGYRNARECLHPMCHAGDWRRCTCKWHNTLWHDSPCLACTHHTMQKKFGNGACGVRMKRHLKSLGHPSHQGAMHRALARFHSEHVGN